MIMKKKTIISIATLLLIGQGAWAQHPEIEGLTYNDTGEYYEIPDAAALNALASYVNDGNTCNGLTFKVTANITFGTNEDFTPIGYGSEEDDGNPFAGTFDGQGFTISDIHYEDEEGVGVGLFGYLFSPALVKNVVLSNCSFTGNYLVGGIAGSYAGANNTVPEWGIYNCQAGDDVTVTATSCVIEGEALDGWYAGGIVGDLGNATAKDCISAATVSGDEYVGGIAGSISSDASPNSDYSGTLTDCYYTGNSVTLTSQDGQYVNDIVGVNGLIEFMDESIVLVENTEGVLNITLLDDDSQATIKNDTRKKNYEGLVVNVTLDGRTLIKDGYWNTLCLPFSVSKFDDTPLAGAEVRTLSSSSFADPQLTINFTDPESSLTANKPYIVKWTTEETTQNADIVGPVFNGVTISTGDLDPISTTCVTFTGNYQSESFTANKKTLYLGAGNALYYPDGERKMGAFRGYFELAEGYEAGEPLNTNEQNPSRFVLITNILAKQLEDKASASSAWFAVDGRRLSSQPTRRGIYVNQGKRVIIK